MASPCYARQPHAPASSLILIVAPLSSRLSRCKPTFSERSHGFRPGRSAAQAVKQAQTCIGEGKRWAVDLDLEKFFDRVNHDVRMSRVARRVHDARVLKRIRRLLDARMMQRGVTTARSDRVP